MRSVIIPVFFVMSVLLVFSSLTAQENLPVYKGPYLGQKPPGKTPVEFAPLLFAAHKPAFGTVFSPDGNEFYFVADVGGEEGGDIVCMKRVNDVWTAPQAADFNSMYDDNDMCISPDGFRMFWRSWRPLPGKNEAEEKSHIWFAIREGERWSQPQPVKYENTPLKAGYPSLSRHGNLFFPFRSENNVGESDIHISRFINGSFSTPENLGRVANTVYIEGDMVVSADESFLIVAGWNRPDNFGSRSSDLYVIFRRSDGTWTKQINMGSEINTTVMENAPMLSPDGKYFFFLRWDLEKDIGGTYWLDAGIIEELKPDGLK